MLRPFSPLIVLPLAFFGLLWDGTILARSDESQSVKDDQYVKVEVKGKLQKGTAATGQTLVPLLLANGLQFELNFRKSPPSSQELDQLYGKTVVAVGILEHRRNTGGEERLICIVEGKLKAVDPVPQAEETEYLVGYKDGLQQAVKELSENLGLQVLEHYKPGKYLRVRPGTEAKLNFLMKLRASDAIRYVEPNATHTIPDGENLPTPSRP